MSIAIGIEDVVGGNLGALQLRFELGEVVRCAHLVDLLQHERLVEIAGQQRDGSVVIATNDRSVNGLEYLHRFSREASVCLLDPDGVGSPGVGQYLAVELVTAVGFGDLVEQMIVTGIHGVGDRHIVREYEAEGRNADLSCSV